MKDLSHPLQTGMQTYPGDPPVRVETDATHADDGSQTTQLSIGSHTGTHVDAPAHLERGGATLGEFDVESFVRDCRRVDCRDLDPREAIPVQRVPSISSNRDCLVFWTGWDQYWGTERYLDHPYLTPEAAEYCAEQGAAIAIDTLNPDPTPSENSTAVEPEGYQAHHALLSEGLLIFENLCNLQAVTGRFELRAYPLRIDSDGAPIRAVGIS